MHENPYRKRLPTRADRKLHKTVWKANEKGEDSEFSTFRLTASDEYLWFGRELSVPLVWIVRMEQVGPGMAITWKNPLDGEFEVSYICIRTFFRYNTKALNKLYNELVSLVDHAHECGHSPEAQAMESFPTCQVCGKPKPIQFEFVWILSIIFIDRSEVKRELLCRAHGAQRLVAVMFANAYGGTLGVPGIFLTPGLVHKQGSDGVDRGLIPRWVHVGFVGLSLYPFIGVLVLIGWVISTLV